MIRTVTLNTGFDEVYAVSDIKPGGVANILEYHSEPSGKGINCAKVLRRLGHDVRAYGLIGHEDRDLFLRSLSVDGIEATLTTVNAPTRRNLTLFSNGACSPAAHFRASGFPRSALQPIQGLAFQLEKECEPNDIISLHGSIPDGCPTDVWSLFVAVAERKKARVALDVYGLPLRLLVENGHVCLCKPNDEEIESLPGVDGSSSDTCTRQALSYMSAHGVQISAVTRGEQGVWFVRSGRLFCSSVKAGEAKVLVGAGDACMAGMLAAMNEGNQDSTEVVALGTAAAAAHVEGSSVKKYRARVETLLKSILTSELGPVG